MVIKVEKELKIVYLIGTLAKTLDVNSTKKFKEKLANQLHSKITVSELS